MVAERKNLTAKTREGGGGRVNEMEKELRERKWVKRESVWVWVWRMEDGR